MLFFELNLVKTNINQKKIIISPTFKNNYLVILHKKLFRQNNQYFHQILQLF